MTLSRARVLSATEVPALVQERARGPREARARRILPAAVVDAHVQAAQVLALAKQGAEAFEAAAHARAAHAAEATAREAREAELARLAAVALHLEARARSLDRASIERTVSLARLLAERVIGAELTATPERIGLMVAELLGETRGATTARVLAGRDDLQALARALSELGFPEGAIELVEDPRATRGSLVLETDVGTVDGRLESRLGRLTAALRAALPAEGA